MIDRRIWFLEHNSGVGSGGASTSPKVLICWKSGQNPWKSKQKWHPTLFDFKKWRPTSTENYTDVFLEATLKNGLLNLCGRKFVGKSHTKMFRTSLGRFGQKSFKPPKICLLLHLCTTDIRINILPGQSKLSVKTLLSVSRAFTNN